MFFKKILVPYDGSRYADKAFEKALEIAKNSTAKIKIITCIFRGHGTDMGWETKFVDLEDKQLRKKAFSRISRLESAAKKSGIDASGTVVKTMDVAEKITNYAKKERFDLIVIGSHGRSGFTRMILGSIANGVLSKTSCPVMIVK